MALVPVTPNESLPGQAALLLARGADVFELEDLLALVYTLETKIPSRTIKENIACLDAAISAYRAAGLDLHWAARDLGLET